MEGRCHDLWYMKPIRFMLILLFAGAFACTTKVEPDPDLPVVSYHSDIAPIINSNCTLNSECHGGQLNYNDLREWVQPGDPYNSELYKIIRSYTQGMPPKPNNPLTDEQIAQIYVWILQGATDN